MLMLVTEIFTLVFVNGQQQEQKIQYMIINIKHILNLMG